MARCLDVLDPKGTTTMSTTPAAAAEPVVSATPPTDPPTGGDPQLAGAALQSALQSERRLREQAERALKAATDAEEARQRQGMDATARLQLERDEALARITALEEAQAKSGKADLVRRAARDFHDPEDAVAVLELRGVLGDIADEAHAVQMVKAIGIERPHLVKTAGGTAAVQPEMAAVIAAGLAPVTATQTPEQAAAAAAAAAADDSVLTYAELKAMTPAQMAEFRENEPEKHDRSFARLSSK